MRIKWDKLCFKTCFANIKGLHKYLSDAWEGREGAILFSAVLFEEQVVSHPQVMKKI